MDFFFLPLLSGSYKKPRSALDIPEDLLDICLITKHWKPSRL